MSRTAMVSDNWKTEANRSWGLTVLKTAYRDTYPKVSAATILKNAKTLEETMFENSNSKEGYDKSVSKAADSIKSGFETKRREKNSSAEDNHTINAGRTPSSRAGRIPSGFHRGDNSGVRPTHDAVRRLRMADGRKSLTPIANASRNQIPLSVGNESRMQRLRRLEEPFLAYPRIDPSDVMKLVPFILEAGFHAAGRMESAEQARNLTEHQKSTITFVALEKLSRSVRFAAQVKREPTLLPEFQESPLSAYEQEQIRIRANNLQRNYMYEMRTICSKLGEKFRTPQSNEMISNISDAFKKLEELEAGSCKISDQTILVLDSVENVFKTAIEQYGHLVKDGNPLSNGFKASQSAFGYINAGPYPGPVSGSHLPGIVGWDSPRGARLENPCYQGEERGMENVWNRHPCSHYEEDVPNRAEFTGYYMLKARYCDVMSKLIPLIKAELGKHHVDRADETCEKMAYILAFLKLDNVKDNEVLRSAEKAMQDLCKRFGYLLQGPRTEPRVENADVAAWNRPSLERTFDFSYMPTSNAANTALAQSARMTAPEPGIFEQVALAECHESKEEEDHNDDDESEGDEFFDDFGTYLQKDDEVESNKKFEERAVEIYFDEPADNGEYGTSEDSKDETSLKERDLLVASSNKDEEETEIEDGEESEESVKEDESEVIAMKEEETSQAAITETMTTRRSRRSTVVAARVKNGEATPSRSTTTPSRSTRTARGLKATPGKRGSTPGRVLRPRKTPLKE